MLRDKMSTKEFAQILGITPSGVYWNIKNKSKEGFPTPIRIRKGTLFEFRLEDAEDWLDKKGIKPKVDMSKLLQALDLPPTRTTTEVLQRMGRKPTKGNRADIARLVKAERLPAPFVRSVGRNGENLWLAEIIDPVIEMGWTNWAKTHESADKP